jgi:steroid 5-alpha reductase family enzyme
LNFILFLRAWGAIALLMAILWARQLRTRNATSVDVAWSASFALIALQTAAELLARGEGTRLRVVGVAALTTFWSVRLASHLYFTRVRGHAHEDGRYAQLRTEWSQTKFFVFYQAQALLAAIFAVPVILVMSAPGAAPAGTDFLGLAIAAMAIGGEALADAQLQRHRQNPANRGLTCRVGLWRYSRHPNYFFEWVHWWAYVAIGVVAPAGWLTLLGPALMLYLMFKVTGIPPTEAQSLKSRRDYPEYQRTTSAFFPWFPKQKEVT